MEQLKVHFHTFGDGTFGIRMAARRLTKQANRSGLFSSSKSWNLADLVLATPEFRKNSNFILNNPKGLGLWVWKPYVLRSALEQADRGEMVVLLDAGCQLNLNSKSLERFKDYLRFTEDTGSLFMQLRNGDFGIQNLSEQAWTKKIALDYLDPKGIIRLTNQIQSGIIFLINNSVSKALVNEWIELLEKENYSLLTSPADIADELPVYVEHRWEQSILSLLVKGKGFNYIEDETFFGPHWENGIAYPIWATRNRSGGDAIRRNFLDLGYLVIAKLEREYLMRIPIYKNFLSRRIKSSVLGK